MTQAELLAKIKAEIERRKSGLKRYYNDDLIKCRAYDEMLSILFTLEESEKPLPADLEEAAENYSKERAEGHILYDWVHAFIAGAKWQADHTPLPEDTVLFQKGVEEGKRLMMEEAVDAIVDDWNPDPEPEITIPLNPEEFTRGDKVRVIVCKKED